MLANLSVQLLNSADKREETKMESMQTVELTPKKIEELNDQPILETFMYVSLDGKWFIHKTITTDIKPISYLKKVMNENEEEI